ELAYLSLAFLRFSHCQAGIVFFFPPALQPTLRAYSLQLSARLVARCNEAAHAVLQFGRVFVSSLWQRRCLMRGGLSLKKRLGFERLEARTVLNGTVMVTNAGGALSITGDASSNYFLVQQT